MQDPTEVSFLYLTRRSQADVCRGVILLKVLEYLSYKVQYADFNASDITEDFSKRIDPYIALEL